MVSCVSLVSAILEVGAVSYQHKEPSNDFMAIWILLRWKSLSENESFLKKGWLLVHFFTLSDGRHMCRPYHGPIWLVIGCTLGYHERLNIKIAFLVSLLSVKGYLAFYKSAILKFLLHAEAIELWKWKQKNGRKIVMAVHIHTEKEQPWDKLLQYFVSLHCLKSPQLVNVFLGSMEIVIFCQYQSEPINYSWNREPILVRWSSKSRAITIRSSTSTYRSSSKTWV